MPASTATTAASTVESREKLHPFVCLTCSKRFTRRDYLTRHELNHNAVKPFKCDQCNLSFTRSDLLSKHFKSKSHQRVRDRITGGAVGAESSSFWSKSEVGAGFNKERRGFGTEDRGGLKSEKSDGFRRNFEQENRRNSIDGSFLNRFGNTEENTFYTRHYSTPHNVLNKVNGRENGLGLDYNKDVSQYGNVSKYTSSVGQKRYSDTDEASHKKFKRLGIADFLNQHHDEKIHTPPPQPSIILPSVSLTLSAIPKNNTSEAVENNEPSDKDNNGHRLQEYQLPPDFYDSVDNKKEQSSGINVDDKSTEKPQNLAQDLENMGVHAQTPDISGGFIDNLFWLFRDVSPLETNSGPTETTFSDDPYGDSIPTSSNYFDISPIMYEDMYNELAKVQNMELEAMAKADNEQTNHKINDIESYIGRNNSNGSSLLNFYNFNKIRIKESTRRSIISMFPSVKELENVRLERFEEYMDLYWFNFAQTFPIIHQATFDPNTVNIYLLISMLIIGMAHLLDKMEYETSVVLNKRYRRLISDVVDECVDLPLPLIQALLLHNFSSKNFGDMKLNQLAQIDHGANILYLKFSGLLDTLTEPLVYKSEHCDLEEMTQQWYNWIHYETCKRTVFFEFICDTQHVTFSKLELLSAFDVKLELPSTDDVWNAKDPVKFFEHYLKQPRGLYPRPKVNISLGRGYNAESSNNLGSENKVDEKITEESVLKFPKLNSNSKLNHNVSKSSYKVNTSHMNRSGDSSVNSNSGTVNNGPIKMISKWPSFLWSLKSMMTTYKENQKEYLMECYSLYSRYIILHGLMRICWDMRGQGLLDLGIVLKKKLNEFFKKLERAFLNWKGYFDMHVRLYDERLKNPLAATRNNLGSQVLGLNNYGRTNAAWANVSFYYTGLFTLYADIPSITKFATEYKTNCRSTSTLYKDLKELEHERNKLLIEQWARSLNGKLSVLEACKFLGLVYKHEETINTFSHVPGTAYIAALMVWCFEIKRDCPNVETLKRAKREEEVNDNGEFFSGINLQVDKYFDEYGNVKHEKARNDAIQYFAMVIDISEGKGKNYEGNDNNENYNGTKIYEEFKERQLKTVAVVCYVLHLLRNCKWSYSVDLIQKLERIVQTYEK